MQGTSKEQKRNIEKDKKWGLEEMKEKAVASWEGVNKRLIGKRERNVKGTAKEERQKQKNRKAEKGELEEWRENAQTSGKA